MGSRSKLDIEIERSVGYLTKLAVPRMAGTTAEREIAGRIEDHFASLGLETGRESFEFGSMRTWIRKSLTSLLPASLFVALFLLYSAPAVSFIAAAVIIALFSYMTRNISKISWLGHEWGKKTQSQNIIAVKPPESDERAHLIVGAHYDSLSLTRCIYPDNYAMAIVMRPVFFASLGILALIGAIGLIKAASGIFPPPAALEVLLWISIMLATLFFTYLVTGHGNDSAGASDNASGVAALMELAHEFSKRPLRHLRLTMAAFGAEEMGLLGSNHHFHCRRGQWKNSRTYVISLDMPAGKGRFGYNAKYGIPPRRTSSYLNGLIREAAEQLGVKCEEIGLTPGSGSDHMPFLEHGIPGAFLSTLSKESMRRIHTSRDDLSAIDYDHLRDSCFLLHRLILNLDESLKLLSLCNREDCLETAGKKRMCEDSG